MYEDETDCPPAGMWNAAAQSVVTEASSCLGQNLAAQTYCGGGRHCGWHSVAKLMFPKDWPTILFSTSQPVSG